jgi:acyl carrier protein
MLEGAVMAVGLDQIASLLGASFGIPADEIGEHVQLSELDVDSLALVEFCLLLEKEFGVPVTEDEIHGEDTVRDVLDLIESKKVAG